MKKIKIISAFFMLIMMSINGFSQIGGELTRSDSLEIKKIIVEFYEQPAFLLQSQNKGFSKNDYDDLFEQFDTSVDSIENELGLPASKTTNREFYKLICGVAIEVPYVVELNIRNLPYVKDVYEDFEVQAFLDENLLTINVDEVWATHCVRGAGIKIAILDTGIDYDNPALGGGFGPGYKVLGGYDFVNDDSYPMDDHDYIDPVTGHNYHSHGTHVAGIVAANSDDIKGVAPEASLLAYKVLNSEGAGSSSDVIAGIEAALDPNNDDDYSDHADIINMSLGGYGNSKDILSQTIETAYDLTYPDETKINVIFCIAAGNFSQSGDPNYGSLSSPGTAPSAITVGACDKNEANGKMAQWSLRGPDRYENSTKPEVVAPGVDIRSTVRVGYESLGLTKSGTSMATPHVTGTCALLMELHPDWTNDQIKSALMSTAVPLYNNEGVVYDAMIQGSGRIDAFAASNVTTVFERVTDEGEILGNDLSFGLIDALTIDQEGSIPKTVNLKVTNIDENSQTYSVNFDNLPTGVSFTSISDFTLASGASTTLQFDITVDNTVDPNQRIFSGNVLVTGTHDTNLHVTWSFVKNHVYWVDDDNGGSNSNPGTEALPFQTIQYALQYKVTDNDYIFVKNGTYGSIYKLQDFVNNVTIASMYYFSNNQNDIAQTIINPTNENFCVQFQVGSISLNGFTVQGDLTNIGIFNNNFASTSLKNLTIENCQYAIANQSNAIIQAENLTIQNNINNDLTRASGIFNLEATFSIINSTIKNNISQEPQNGMEGAGILNEHGGIINIDNCNIFNNQNGTTPYAYAISNKNIMNISNSNISNHEFNSAIGSLGILNITNSNLYENKGGIFSYGIELKVDNCNFYDNSGRCIYSNGDNNFIDNSTFFDNTSDYLFIFWDGNFFINNVTISNNLPEKLAGFFGDNLVLSMNNSILYNNNNKKIEIPHANTVSVEYCNIQDGESIFSYGSTTNLTFENNIDSEPFFVSPSINNYYLETNSPCIDAGDPLSSYKNEPMPHGCRVNMGAYGNTSEATSKDIAQQYAEIDANDYYEDFENDTQFDQYWTQDGSFTIQNLSGSGANGSDYWAESVGSGTKQLIFHANLDNVFYPVLSYFTKKTASTNPDDGIYLASDCGSNYVKVAELTGDETKWNYRMLNLRKLAQDNGLSISESFSIMFQYEAGSTDFFAIDNFKIFDLKNPGLSVNVKDCDNADIEIQNFENLYTYNIHYGLCDSGTDNVIDDANQLSTVTLSQSGCYYFYAEIVTEGGNIDFDRLELSLTVDPSPTTNLQMNGNTVCVNEDGWVQIFSPDTYTTYQAYIEGQFVGSAVSGGGSPKSIMIYISKEDLKVGKNYVKVFATNDCGTVEMDNIAVITNNSPDNSLTILGSNICVNEDFGSVQIYNPEIYTTYKAYIDGNFVGSAVSGGVDQKSISIYISKKDLTFGENNIDVFATNDCGTVKMKNSAVITVIFCHGGEIPKGQKSSSINLIDLDNMFSVNPNPADDFLILNVQSGSIINGKVGLYDLAGKEVIRISDYSISPGINEISVSNLPTGIYFLRADTEYGSIVKKVIIN